MEHAIDTAAEPEASAGDRRKWLVLIAMVFGLFMPMLDNLVVNVALPTIQKDLGAGVSQLQWLIDAYTLTFASFMLTGGALGDLYGRKRFFMTGVGRVRPGFAGLRPLAVHWAAHHLPRVPGPG